jgi:hypothetical protein
MVSVVEEFGMRLSVISRVAALISCAALLSACPKKDSDVAPEPATPGAAQPAPASDKAGAEAPAAAAPAAAAPAAAAPAAAPPKKKDDDKGGW